MNIFETVRGVRFLDIIPEKMAEIAKELKKSNDIQSKRNSILEEQNRLLMELCHLKAENPDVQKES